jgi:hypothetical protein
VSADLAVLTGLPPSAVPLRILHVHTRREMHEARRAAAHERSLGWDVGTCGLLAAPRRLRRTGSDVVALHGRTAGLIGRLLLRGARPTVLVPRPGTWPARRGPGAALTVAWERCAAGWASAVLLTEPEEAAAGVGRRIWTPPFVVGGSPELRAAVLTRAHAYGRPSARSVTPAPAGHRP